MTKSKATLFFSSASIVTDARGSTTGIGSLGGETSIDQPSITEKFPRGMRQMLSKQFLDDFKTSSNFPTGFGRNSQVALQRLIEQSFQWMSRHPVWTVVAAQRIGRRSSHCAERHPPGAAARTLQSLKRAFVRSDHPTRRTSSRYTSHVAN